MSVPSMSELVNYLNRKLTGRDWNTNFQTIVNWLTNGQKDLTVKNLNISAQGQINNEGSMTVGQNLTVNGDADIAGQVQAQSFKGDGSQLTGIISAATVSYVPFSVNSGNTATDGSGDILERVLSGGTYSVLRFKVGGTNPAYPQLKATTAQGLTFELESISEQNVSSVDSGTWIVFVKENQQQPEFRKALFVQSAQPDINSSPEGTVWLDTSAQPLTAKIKASGTWQPYDGVPVGQITLSGGAITEVNTYRFNQNQYSVNLQTMYFTAVPNYTAGISQSWNTNITAEQDGWVKISSHLNTDASITVTVNDIAVFYDHNGGSSVHTTHTFFFPVKKGDVYKATGGMYESSVTFYPNKEILK